MMAKNLHAALKYAEKGVSVFPTIEKGPKAKAPYTTNGYKDATTNIEQIKKWWSQIPNANIGIPTGKKSGFCVIDIDQGNGKDGEKSFSKLELPEDIKTLQVSTPSGGRHLLFKCPDDLEVKNDTGMILGDWIDIRGEGGYIIAPPSSTEKGSYTFKEGYDPETFDLAPLPELIKERIKIYQQTNGKGTSKKNTNVELLNSIHEGSRNQQLTRRCGYLFRVLGIRGSSTVRKYLHEINENCCNPPLCQREVDAIWYSIAKKEARNV